MNKTRERWLAIGLIVLVTLVTYGILIPQLGFYKDDWYLFSTAQSQGPSGIVALFQIDRPLVGYLYALGYQLLGVSPLAWQLAALLMRIAGNLAFFWLLCLLWPRRPMEILALALLFCVYPGFTVQPNAGVYITDLLANAAALASIALTIQVVQSSSQSDDPAGPLPARPFVRWALSALAGLLALFYLGIFEGAIGLEAARLGLVWYVIWQRERVGFRPSVFRALKADLLYILLAGAFLIWRIFLFQSTRRATDLSVLVGRYATLPLHSSLSIVIETLKDIVETVVFAWTVPFYQFVATSNYRDLAIAVVLALLIAACVLLVFRRMLRAAAMQAEPSVNQDFHLIALGAWITVFALLPIDLAGRNVLFADQWDRYTIYASAGVAMLTGGFIFHFFSGGFRTALLLVLIGMSVVVHYFSAASYRDFWAWERDMWQQMVWRAPALQPGTMLFAILPSAGYAEGYEIYGPANMVYYPGQALQLGGEVLNARTAANLELQKNRSHYDRSVLVQDNYRNALIMAYPDVQSCLHLLDGRKIELPGLLDNSLLADAAPYSRIDLVQTASTSVVLPAFLSGEHPPPWCQYYEKMDLARQKGDWKEVASLADEAQKKGLNPEDVSEWMPALEAYASLGRMQEARHAASIIRSSDEARAFLCLQLQRGATYPPPYNYVQVNQTLCQGNE